MKNVSFALLLLALLAPLMACGDDDNPTGTTGKITLSFNGLQDLGANAMYEGWVIVDGNAVSTGTFSVDASGQPSQTEFDVDESDLSAATSFVLTIEPVPDSDPAPSEVHILGGDFSGSSASLAISDGKAIGTDFSSASGQVILATPSTAAAGDSLSGIWFVDPPGQNETLDLPTLPDGWKYEGWAVIDGTPLTSGKFTAVDQPDESAPYSGTMDVPPYPGEDYVVNAPAGTTFPTDLSGSTIVITVEPNPDNSPMPFTLKPLAGTMPMDAVKATLYDLNLSMDSFPTGTASR